MSQSQYYVTHYFNAQNAGSFMAVSLIGLIVVLAIVLLTAKLQKHYKINIENPTEVELAQIEQTHKTKVISWIESFYEMVFSSTSVLIFLSLYYVLDERIPQAAYFWNKYQDILLMVFLVCSVFLTFWFDRIFVHLKTISSEQKASVRLISAFYIILILLYIKFIYNDSNYDSLIFYFVMLAIGRFVYFDSTLDYIKESLKKRREIPAFADFNGRLFWIYLLVWIFL